MKRLQVMKIRFSKLDRSFAVLWLAGWAAVNTASAATLEYEIQAYVDGRDLLSIAADSLQWHHLEYAAVGRWGGNNYPTIISCWSNGVATMTNVEWYPTWPALPPNEIRYDAYSSLLTSLTPALPTRDMTVMVQAIQARSVLAVYQLPNSTNSYTLILDFNDNAVGNPSIGYAAWYKVHVTVTPSMVAPLFTSITQSGDAIQLTWDAVSGRTYQLQRMTDLPGASWDPLQTITATNTVASTLDSSPTNAHCFYRLLAQ
jgi:hypothetical protein